MGHHSYSLDLGHGTFSMYSNLDDTGDFPTPSFTIGRYAFPMHEHTKLIVDLLNKAALAKSPAEFERVIFHLDGDPTPGNDGGPLDMHVELKQEGLFISLYALGRHTGSGVIIPRASSRRSPPSPPSC